MKRILIVDDHAANLYMLRALLQGHGFKVDEALHGGQALEHARLNQPDLVISDLLMPVMDGYTLLRHWKADDRLRAIPFVVYTATYTDPADEALAVEMGADAFLIKPTEPRLLVQCIQEVLERASRGGQGPAMRAVDEHETLKLYNEVLVRKLEKRSEQLEQRVAELTELEAFNFSVSHDLRAPLAAIHGFSSLVLKKSEGQLDDSLRDMLKRVLDNAERMSRLIEDLLSLARASRQEMQTVEMDLSELARSVVDNLRRIDPARTVDVCIAPGMKVHADPGLMRIMMENLVGNAWKFTAQTAQASISIGCEPCEGGTACFVRDNGAGFDMANADKLFAPFQRMHRTDEFEGSGIGLSIVKRIVNRHDGRIWAEASPGHGATMRFSLPSV